MKTLIPGGDLSDAGGDVTGHPVTAGMIMSVPVLTISPDASPWSAWSAMTQNRVRHLVVVAGGRCAGVLEDREVFAQWPVGPLALRRQRIAGMIRPRTTCVLAAAEVREVALVMTEDGVDAVPVVDEIGNVIGVVTGSDVAGAVARWGLYDD